ncbi:MAG: sigma-54 interaction domain-containing protein [Bacillota bacterium]
MSGNKSPLESAACNTPDLDSVTLRKIIDNSYDEIYVTDKNGIVIYVNSACERHYGLKPADVIGKSAAQLSDEGYWNPSLTPFILRDKKRVTLEQVTNIGRKLVVTATPVFDEKGEIELVVQNCRDITQIEEIKKNLEQTSQLVLKYKQEIQELRKSQLSTDNIVCHSKHMKEVLELAQKVAAVDSNIFILGESGTGKGVMARHIHKMSKRKDGPFITINCAAIPDELLESELFGYDPGAFTGADKNGKIGLVELANGGTLFLDEIAEMPVRLQAKILHVIQEHQYTSLGGREVKKMDCRIIAATNRNLEKSVKDGSFREDLYYRLKVIELEIPPLRERIEDIIPLIYMFLNKFDKKYKTVHQFSQESLDMLVQHPWPGNVRELEHIVERLVITVEDDMIKPEHLPGSFHKNMDEQFDIPFIGLVPLDLAFELIEKKLISKAYKQLGSSYKVAKALNISQSRASRLIRRYHNDTNPGEEQ